MGTRRRRKVGIKERLKRGNAVYEISRKDDKDGDTINHLD